MDSDCRKAAHNVGTANAEYKIEKKGLIVLVALTAGAVPILVRKELWKRFMYHSNFLAISGILGQRQMHDSMQREFLWPHMSIDKNTTASNCSICARNGVKSELKIELKLFPASSLLYFVTINSFAHSRRALKGNQYVVVMTDRYSKRTQAMSTSKPSSYFVTNVFSNF